MLQSTPDLAFDIIPELDVLFSILLNNSSTGIFNSFTPWMKTMPRVITAANTLSSLTGIVYWMFLVIPI